MNGTLRALKALLWFVALSHLVIGVGGFLSTGFQEQIARLYGADLAWTGPLSYVAQMLGAFMVGLGVAGVAAARDPLRYRAVVVAFAVVLGLRVVQRLFQLELIEATFAVPTARVIVNAVVFALLAIALLVLLVRVSRAGQPEGA